MRPATDGEPTKVRQLVGNIDLDHRGVIGGWVFDRDYPDLPLDLDPASATEIVQVVELLPRSIVGRRRYWLQSEPEQLECFVLGGGWPGDHGERIVRGYRGNDGVLSDGCEICEQGLEAVYRQPIGAQFRVLFLHGSW